MALIAAAAALRLWLQFVCRPYPFDVPRDLCKESCFLQLHVVCLSNESSPVLSGNVQQLVVERIFGALTGSVLGRIACFYGSIENKDDVTISAPAFCLS